MVSALQFDVQPRFWSEDIFTQLSIFNQFIASGVQV